MGRRRGSETCSLKDYSLSTKICLFYSKTIIIDSEGNNKLCPECIIFINAFCAINIST
jgi:hypothetical protein